MRAKMMMDSTRIERSLYAGLCQALCLQAPAHSCLLSWVLFTPLVTHPGDPMVIMWPIPQPCGHTPLQTAEVTAVLSRILWGLMNLETALCKCSMSFYAESPIRMKSIP